MADEFSVPLKQSEAVKTRAEEMVEKAVNAVVKELAEKVERLEAFEKQSRDEVARLRAKELKMEQELESINKAALERIEALNR